MTVLSTLARPYAKAAFEAALTQQALTEWQTWLSQMAQICQDAAFKKLLKDPRLQRQDKADQLNSLVKPSHDVQRRLVELLAHHHRLHVVPAIAADFASRVRAHEAVVAVRVQTASDLSAKEQSQVEKHLHQALGQTVTCAFEHRPELIGGLRCLVGDAVFDASVLNQLTRMKSDLIQALH